MITPNSTPSQQDSSPTAGPRTLSDRLENERFALSFSGQGFDWLRPLAEATEAGADESRLRGIVADAEQRLSELNEELAGVLPLGFTPFRWAGLDDVPAGSDHGYSANAAVSVPGIVLAQIATLDALGAQDVPWQRAELSIGHSQGHLGVEYARTPERASELLVIARLIGAAITRTAQRSGVISEGERRPMLAIGGVERSIVEEELHGTEAVVGLHNAPDAQVIVGTPAELELVQQRLSRRAEKEQQALENKERGGSALRPTFSPIAVTAGFHHPVMEDAVQLTLDWARRLEVDEQLAERCARAVLVDSVDWPRELRRVREAGVSWLLEIGPGEGVAKLSAPQLAGTGIAVVRAGTAEGQGQLSDPHAATPQAVDYTDFAPRLSADGRRVETAFTRLTGRSPILLAGMTPTTVDPEIVAAAANAGYWAELAGGGQVTPEILDENLTRLGELLEPGVNAQFNSMFLDPYLWGMHIGGKKLVRKARAHGAPIDGVVITAGIPEREEAVQLIHELRAEGIPWVAFKPGAVKHIKQVLAIAREVPEVPVIMHVEGGVAGGHHSWESLDDLLLNTYEQIRRQPNTVLVVGGGIGTPERAADYITGRWAEAYGRVAMPVDGVLVGTAAMAAREACTSPQVKQALVDTAGPNDWVPAGSAKGGMASGRSQLGADIHEIDNSFARAGRLLDEVAGDAEAVAARREEIITAINATCKKYFGDLEEMSYRSWLERYLELSGPDGSGWVDKTWHTRFQHMLQRTEARLNPADHGEHPSQLSPLELGDDPAAAVAEAAAAYDLDRRLHPADVEWFIAELRTPGKPVNFVPVIDENVRRWWRSDSLWQAHDPRYSADEVCIIPGPVAVAGITIKDEPIAELLGRFDAAVVEAARDREAATEDTPSRLSTLLSSPTTYWAGRNVSSILHALAPAAEWEILSADSAREPRTGARLQVLDDTSAELVVSLAGERRCEGLELRVKLELPQVDGAAPVVTQRAAEEAMDTLTEIAAGGSVAELVEGAATHEFTIDADRAADYHNLTSAALRDVTVGGSDSLAPDVLVGACWPAIFAAVRGAEIPGRPGERVVEGMLSLVHLEHHLTLRDEQASTAALIGVPLTATAHADEVSDTDIGRVVVVRVSISDAEGRVRATLTERFAIRGRRGPATARTNTSALPSISPVTHSARTRAQVVAPESMLPFAAVSGDRNPIHVSSTAAHLAGLDDVIVHGMWTSAVAELVTAAAYADDAVHTESAAITEFTATMLRPIAPGETVDFKVERTGVDNRPGRGEVREVTASVDGETVLTAVAVMATPTTFYAFPGQGIQHEGMGMEAYASSREAKQVWDRADAHTRAALGFSVLEIVRTNPREVVVGGERFFHPDGVLFLTQFTQVAMATLGVAQVAQMREAGVLDDTAFFAGHSVGEYNALAAYSGVLSLESVVEIVYARGLTMHRLVERDEQGVSNYGLAALRPNKFGLAADQVADFVAEVSHSTGEFLEIANYNLKGKQYAVAGTRAGLKALAAAAEQRAPGARGLILIPGIDVPFHSSVLRDGVDDFRDHLDSLLPAEIDPEVLVGRYIPNLVARPFAITAEFVESMREVVDSPILDRLLERFDAAVAENTAAVARTILIELLAWQFASPVRWIETQDLMLAELGVERFVEIGVANAPTLANIMAQTAAVTPGGEGLEVLNIERDRGIVFAEDSFSFAAPEEEEAPAESAEDIEPAPAAPATPPVAEPEPAPAPAPAAAAGDTPEVEFTPAHATTVLLSLWTKVQPGQITATDTIETLTDGVSSRRNQLLLDLGVEFGLGAIDGAADAEIPDLQDTVSRMAKGYQAFGPVLGDAISDGLRKVTGPAGAKPAAVAERVSQVWQLGEGWRLHAEAQMVLGTRDGDSVRGGALAELSPAQPSSASELDQLIDNAVLAAGERLGVSVAKPAAAGGEQTAVDSAALGAFAEQVTGKAGVLAETARMILKQLGHDHAPQTVGLDDHSADEKLFELVSAELGQNWPRMVSRNFDPRRAVLLDDRWASAREDITRAGLGLVDPESIDVSGAGETVAAHARHFGLDSLAHQALEQGRGSFAEDVAVVTGSSPQSIAAAVVGELLAEGATVITTTSRLSHERLEFYKRLYAEHARFGATLWVIPANLASYADLDAVVEWIGSEQRVTVGASSVVTKPALVPSLIFPFAAPPVQGSIDEAGPQAENQMRLLLWSVERLIAGLSALGRDTHVGQRTHVVLPGSPNRGIFGGDGAYGESKAALDALVNRWSVEENFSARTTLAHALIGWVRGTGLMGANDPLVELVEAKGVRTYSTDEIARELISLASQESRQAAADTPLLADFTGGLAEAQLNLAELARSAAGNPEAEQLQEVDTTPRFHALPNVPALPAAPATAAAAFHGSVSASLENMVVMVSAAELGPYGSSRTRFEAELSGDLSAAGVVELAWSMGLISYEDGAWLTAEGEEIAEDEIFDAYHDEVLGRVGVRQYHDDFSMVSNLAPQLSKIYLEEDLTFAVATREEAEGYAAEDSNTVVRFHPETEEWLVTRPAGSEVRVPTRAVMSRFVGGQIPEGFDPTRWGIPAEMVNNLDRVAVWNLVCTVDAFLSAGFTPAEILAHVHPAKVSSTQGTGMGGMSSMRSLYVDGLLNEARANDILQEALPNVVAAHVMQAYVGGYGQMVHPVAACATAAVSVEEGMDKIRLGKADVVVTGGIDDLSVEGITGFGDMSATADSQAMRDKGIEDRYFSRANDRRRGGFVESAGGGTLLLMRGSVALELGMPVQAVVGYAQSFADGLHTSIPAPGLGALAAAQGGTHSALATQLAELGVHADDIRVVSKHDTSTNANDPNESELHERIQQALGRDAGSPLYVISQKSLTGHAKGGAAAFQLTGLAQVLCSGVIPANFSLDCVDPVLAEHPHLVWLRQPLKMPEQDVLKAGFVSSLGFGHVSALVALVHPAAFYEAVRAQRGEDVAAEWAAQAAAREQAGAERILAGIYGAAPLYERTSGRNLGGDGDAAHDREIAMLLDADARLRDGRYRLSTEG
ncbi:type I polyketide synthase [Corynebacterium sp. 11A]|uniref:type I polyketide synthase n=1 Tax=Corynebacterium sp. 11A TaxID=2080510 RepID=UPI00124C5DF1|nr:type I polyketide synthase [Corynebacterium sp. 11A]